MLEIVTTTPENQVELTVAEDLSSKIEDFFNTREGAAIAPAILLMSMGDLDKLIKYFESGANFFAGKSEYSFAGPLLSVTVALAFLLVLNNYFGVKKYRKKWEKEKERVTKSLPGVIAPGKNDK